MEWPSETGKKIDLISTLSLYEFHIVKIQNHCLLKNHWHKSYDQQVWLLHSLTAWQFGLVAISVWQTKSINRQPS